MKKLYKILFIFILGIILGYYLCKNNDINLFNKTYKAFQVGVYTNYETALLYSEKYNNSIIIKDNELYRIYVSILKDSNNINYMSKYLDNNNISFYLKDIDINNIQISKDIEEYENLINDNEIVLNEVNKKILERYNDYYETKRTT